jgi:ferredoxin
MSLKHLKTIRLVVSVSFLILISFFFIDLGRQFPPGFITGILAFQLVPAVMKSIGGAGLWTVGCAVILLVTFCVGRIYCSTLCPLGTFQDFFIRIAKRRNRKRWFVYRRPDYAIHYLLLAGSVFLAIGGSMALVELLEPFSNYGRIVQGLMRPVLVVLNNLGAWILGRFGTYGLNTIPLLGLSVGVIIVPFFLALFLGWLSYRYGRLFCNLLCPAGALLSLVSRFSLMKIVIDETTCRDCGLCEMVCKANCIDAEKKVVNYSACINCFNCIKACPTVGLKYAGFSWGSKPVPQPIVNQKRRDVLKSLAIPGAMLLQAKSDSTLTLALQPRQLHPVTPPGSAGLERFSQLCTACHLCVSACPTRVLVPSVFDYGLTGVFQPKLDYWVSFCNYDCIVCGAVCPTGAILPLPVEDKKLVQMGKSIFVKDECIVITKKADCGACSEHCPTKAVHMVPYGKLMLPELKDDLCIGCGACEYACPTKPRKAIYVEANVVHQRAEQPPVKKLEEESLKEGTFPF